MEGVNKSLRLLAIFIVALLSFQNATAQQENSTQQAAARAELSPLNINTATLSELQSLRGVGPKTAESIVAWREEHGPFVMPDQLMAIRGIGPKTYEQLAPYVTVGE